MRRSRPLGRALTFCLVISAVGSCRTSASPKGNPAGPAIKPPLVATEPPPDASRSKWVNENWKLQKTALAKAGLAAVQLAGWLPRATVRNDLSAPWRNFRPESGCQLFENLPDAPPRLLYNGSGQFAVSADGKLHCLFLVYSQALGQKKETLEGQPRNCTGGAQLPPQVDSHLFVVPEGMSVGEPQTVQLPYYDLDIRYTEQCPLVPSARF